MGLDLASASTTTLMMTLLNQYFNPVNPLVAT